MSIQPMSANKKTTLFVLPFAGASNHSYRDLITAIDHNLNIEVISLPGRGNRVLEPLLRNMTKIVEEVYWAIRGKLQMPYAIYGHSMGAILGYLVTKRLLHDGLPAPVHLFFSGRGAPSVKYDEPPTQTLSKHEFISKLKQLGGSPDEILNDSSLMDFFEPILRADFEAVENYTHQTSEPLAVPISVMVGTEEKTTYEDALAWQEVSHFPIDVLQYPGKHFFIFEHQADIMRYISNKLNQKIAI